LPAIDDELNVKRLADVVQLKNKSPVWNELLGAYTLDFGEHVKLPSKKNFQMIEDGRRTYQFL